MKKWSLADLAIALFCAMPPWKWDSDECYVKHYREDYEKPIFTPKEWSWGVPF